MMGWGAAPNFYNYHPTYPHGISLIGAASNLYFNPGYIQPQITLIGAAAAAEAAEQACTQASNSATGQGRANVSFGTPESKIIDLGCSHHMTPNTALFKQYSMRPYHLEISLGDDSKVAATHKGTIEMAILVDGREKIWMLHDVLLVPGLAYDLISVSKLTDEGKHVYFEDNGCNIVDEKTGKVVAQARKYAGHYLLNEPMPTAILAAAALLARFGRPDADRLRNFHERMGHIGVKRMKEMVRHQMALGMDIQLRDFD
jgi:hypothetical protein